MATTCFFWRTAGVYPLSMVQFGPCQCDTLVCSLIYFCQCILIYFEILTWIECLLWEGKAGYKKGERSRQEGTGALEMFVHCGCQMYKRLTLLQFCIISASPLDPYPFSTWMHCWSLHCQQTMFWKWPFTEKQPKHTNIHTMIFELYLFPKKKQSLLAVIYCSFPALPAMWIIKFSFAMYWKPVYMSFSWNWFSAQYYSGPTAPDLTHSNRT